MSTPTLNEVNPVSNMRVRFVSDNPEHEPQGTLTDVGYAAVTITWDDNHKPSCVERGRWNQLEVI